MNKKLSNEQTGLFCRELSLLLSDGSLSNGDALFQMAEETEEGEEKELLIQLAKKADRGPLSAALRDSGSFPDYVSGMVEVGERTKGRSAALSALAKYYEDRVRMARRVRSALLYPIVMLVLMLVVIAVLLVKVLPIFDSVYASLGGRLSGVAGGLLALGRVLEGAMPVLWALLVLLAVLVLAFLLSESFQKKLLLFWQKHWGDRGVSRKLNDARVARVMAMGMTSGMLPEEALELAAGLVEGGARERCQDCYNRLLKKEKFADALRASSLLPASQCHLLAVSRQSKDSPEIMDKIAGDLAEEGESALEALTSRVEPALVLVCSLLVGLILLSVMLPLMNIMAAIG